MDFCTLSRTIGFGRRTRPNGSTVTDSEVVVSDEKLYVVRCYEGFEEIWFDVSKPVSKAEADCIWGKLTENGTLEYQYDGINNYYKVFPADTRMFHS